MNDSASPTLRLASRSPRRAELLQALGVAFELVDVEIDESRLPDEPPEAYVTRLARAKAAAGGEVSAGTDCVLAADTCVALEHEIFGKPKDRDDALHTLLRLSGRWHEVYTGVSLTHPTELTVCVRTRVLFRNLTTREVAAYWASGEPSDKAGSYGIQGLGGALIERIEGSYSNVVGLPLAETLALLNRAGIHHWLAV
ncbi:MAG: septum formation inhibitor Maf [Gammaproteobacteria bacterium]|nr:septum formation inhibitor Maf [Gammaproteobacteria bacterium]